MSVFKTSFVFVMVYFFSCLIALGQDTLQLNFKFGSSRLKKSEKEKLEARLENTAFFQIDSIQFIGMSDTVGHAKNNLKLSEKRVNHVLNLAQTLIPEEVKVSTAAIGEKNADAESRRVLLIFHSNIEDLIDSTTTTEEEKVLDDCFYVDYTLLNTANISIVKRGRREYVLIESSAPMNYYNVPDYFRPIDYTNHFYSDTNANGELVVKKVKWRRKNTGELWWRNSRYVALIPKSSFDQNQILIKDKGPCSDCSLFINNKLQKPILKSKRHIDNFASNHMQFKRKWLRKKTVVMRVPTEYINPSYRYYPNKLAPALEWKTKGGKKNQFYQFTTVKINQRARVKIYRDFKYCEVPIRDSSELSSFRILCGGIKYGPSIYGPRRITIESGVFSNGDINVPYVAGNLSLNRNFNRLSANLIMGFTDEADLFGNGRIRYAPFRIPLGKNIGSAYKWTSAHFLAKTNYWFAKPYLGLDAVLIANTNNSDLFPSLNLGLNFQNRKRGAILSGCFVQAGGWSNTDTYWQLGIQFRIAKDN